MNNIQISRDLFLDICDYFLSDEYSGAEWLANDIRKGLQEKLDKLIAHELYSQYKRLPTGAERENARKKYLDQVGIDKDFRSDKEIHYS